MAGVLNTTTTDTMPKAIQFQENGLPKDMTGYTVSCRIGTPTPTAKVVNFADPTTGEGLITWGGLPAGSYNAEMVIVKDGLQESSELFTINVRAGV